MDINIPKVSTLKQLARKEHLKVEEAREIILWYIYFNTAVYVPQCMTATINNIVEFDKNTQIAKLYFLSFTDE